LIQTQIPFAKPLIGEEEADAVREVVASGWLSQGKKVAEFETRFAEYVGTADAVAFFNGTVALHAILIALDIGPDDEVIVPSISFISTATSVVHAGATPVFADVDPRTYNIDPADVRRKITGKTRAVIAVHYAGQPADFDELLPLCQEAGVQLIEDAAEAHGARWRNKRVGSFGRAAMFSFTPTKNITTGEGGIVATNDPGLAERLRLLRNHGSDREYHHIEVGYNYRMTEMQAALGIVQLNRLDGILADKQQCAAYLSRQLGKIPGISPPFVDPRATSAFMMYTIQVEPPFPLSRDELKAYLAEQGIPTKIYFPPIHLQPVFKKSRQDSLPVTESLAKRVLSLPFFVGITEEELDYMAETIRSRAR